MNSSKANDPRFWNLWRASGAVSGMPSVQAAKAPKTAPVKAQTAPATSAPKVKAAKPPATPAVFGTKDLGKDANPRWAVVNKGTKQVVDHAPSRTKARELAKTLTAEAAAA